MRIAPACAITSLLGVIYGFTGLYTSWQEFAVGLALAITGLLGYVVAIEW